MWVEQISGRLWSREDGQAMVVRVFSRYYALWLRTSQDFGPFGTAEEAQNAVDGALNQ